MQGHELNVEQLELMQSPVRAAIVDFLIAHGPASVNEIAPEIDMSPKALYFHIRQLEAAGLVRPKETRLVVKRIETVYECVANYFSFDPSTTDPTAQTAYADTVISMVRNSVKQFARASKELTPEDSRRLAMRLHTANVRLSEEAIRMLEEKMLEWVLWTKSQAPTDDTPATRVSLTLLLSPVLEKRSEH